MPANDCFLGCCRSLVCNTISLHQAPITLDCPDGATHRRAIHIQASRCVAGGGRQFLPTSEVDWGEFLQTSGDEACHAMLGIIRGALVITVSGAGVLTEHITIQGIPDLFAALQPGLGELKKGCHFLKHRRDQIPSFRSPD